MGKEISKTFPDRRGSIRDKYKKKFKMPSIERKNVVSKPLYGCAFCKNYYVS